MLLDSLKSEVTEMIDLAQRIENYNSTVQLRRRLASRSNLGMPRMPNGVAVANGSQSCGQMGRVSTRKSMLYLIDNKGGRPQEMPVACFPSHFPLPPGWRLVRA